jgi:hypothetical protein
MKTIVKTACVVALFLTSTCLVKAQATRTWVSGVGDDANPCSRTAPCKTFAGAISKTAAGGEIDALDPGGFGALTITKAITIDGGGGQVASVLVAGTNGINVQAGMGDVVVIRNLSITGINQTVTPGINGVNFTSGKELHLEHVTIFGFSTNGLNYIAPGSTSNTGFTSVMITDSVIRDNTGTGVFMSLPSGTASGAMKLTMTSSSVNSNTIGVIVRNLGSATIQDSSISNNIATGVFSLANTGTGASNITVEHCTISNNGVFGVLAGDSSTTAASNVWLANNTITSNTTGVSISTNGHIFTYSNNRIAGNGTDGCSGCTPMGQN